jgi:cell division protein FtsW (lipid II flippase)
MFLPRIRRIPPSPLERIRQIEAVLLGFSTAFVILNTAALALAPIVQTGGAGGPLSSGRILLPMLAWIGAAWLGHFFLNRQLPARDPILFPAAMLLAGWGLMILVRISEMFALRQTVWLILAVSAILLITRFPSVLALLRRYRYLTAGAALAGLGLTFVLGTAAHTGAEKLWIGWGGIFFQPSEFLKWLLPAFAAFSLDLPHIRSAPSVRQILIVLCVGLLFAGAVFLQQDTGTALILFLGLAVMLYLGTGKPGIPIGACLAVLAAGVAGYGVNGILHARIDTWWNPWWDASNTSYQVVQSLIAIASGGIIGRGPGLGFPQLVPVTVSDFLFTALAEEYGLVGALGCLAVLSVFVMRGLRVAAVCADRGLGMLAGGISMLVGLQAVIIAGGGVRLLPLTGVTFPWMSYGGSSLLSCAIGLGLLLLISAQPVRGDSALQIPLQRMGFVFLGCIGALAVILGWWGVYRSPVLRARTDNIRRILHDQTVARGNLYDRQGAPLALTVGTAGSYTRAYPNSEAAAVTGYSSQRYGQGGIEAALDPWLRGETSHNEFETWWSETVLGVPLRGQGARLTIDGDLQKEAGRLLGARPGAVVVMRARSGELLALASHPTYDPARVDEDWAALLEDPGSPLLNRATQGLYAPGSTLLPFVAAQAISEGWTPENLDFCRMDLPALARAYPDLAEETFSHFRLQEGPIMDLPAAYVPPSSGTMDAAVQARALEGHGRLLISPMQLALSAASLFADGMEPAPKLIREWETAAGGWDPAPPAGHPLATVNADIGARIAAALSGPLIKEWPACGKDSPWTVIVDTANIDPVMVVVLLEDGQPGGEEIARQLIQTASRVP